jgi:hypothetical protein
MFATPLSAGPLRGLVQRVQDWPVASQQQARRNAMIATTACAHRRIEREDVADYLDSLTAPVAAEAPAATTAPPVAGRVSHA